LLSLPDEWIWDSWIAAEGSCYHLFFLKAPRSLVDPGRRHTHATIGHATSSDLCDWQYHGDALLPAASGWDDLALWTGSVARGDDGVWRLYYTALSSDGHGVRDQRIGLAESDDLYVWRRVGEGPILEVEPRWYKTLDVDSKASETWRDPFVFRDPDGDGWHMLITARAKDAPRYRDGVLGHARSADMCTWELGPPVSDPAGFGQTEVAQVRLVDGQPLLVFCCHPDEQSEEWKQTSGLFCTWSVVGDSLTGPWDLARAKPFTEEPALFAAPLVQQPGGGWALLGFRNLEAQGDYACEIIDPIPVQLQDGGLIANLRSDTGSRRPMAR
jgi:beta-fructofuranosidase